MIQGKEAVIETLFPIGLALGQAQQFIGEGLIKLIPQNKAQEELIKFLGQIPPEEYTKLQEEILLKGAAKKTAAEINKVLVDWGSPVEIDDLDAPNNFYIASLLDMSLKWLQKGDPTTIEVLGKNQVVRNYDGFELSTGFSFFRSSVNNALVTKISTRNGLDVYVTKHVGGVSNAPLSLLKRAGLVQRSLVPEETGFTFISLPNLNLKYEPDLSWLEGLRLQAQGGRRAKLLKALQSSNFLMDKSGASGSSSFAAAVEIESFSGYVFDDDLLIWIMRGGGFCGNY